MTWSRIGADAPLIEDMLDQGFSTEQIAEEMGVLYSSVLRRLRRSDLHELADRLCARRYQEAERRVERRLGRKAGAR